MTSRGRQSLTQIPSTPRPYRAPASRAASALPEHHLASSALSIPPASYKGFRFLAATREDETVRTMGTADAANRSEGAADGRAQSLRPRSAQELLDVLSSSWWVHGSSLAVCAAPHGVITIAPAVETLPFRRRSYDYSLARDTMAKKTPNAFAPWVILQSENRRTGRLNTIAHLLSPTPRK
jgi:hypothetical protein